MGEVYFLGGKGQLPAEVRSRLPKKRDVARTVEIHGKVFDALFPAATAEQRTKAIDSFDAPFFVEMLPMPQHLEPVLGFLALERKVLITDWDTYCRLEEPHDFDPVILLQEAKPGTHFWVTPEGRVMEFTWPVPIAAARQEVELLRSLGGIEIGGAVYGEMAQLVREPKPGERYFGWMRMNKFLPAYALLAQLEGISLEQFLAQAGERLGAQLKKVHDQKLTFHQSEGGGTAPNEPLFSHLWGGHVEIHGNLVEITGLRPMDQFEPSQRVRIADLQGVLGGAEARNLAQSFRYSLFEFLRGRENKAENFIAFAIGLFCGYAGITETTAREGISAKVTAAVESTGYAQNQKGARWIYALTQGILEHLEGRA